MNMAHTPYHPAYIHTYI